MTQELQFTIIKQSQDLPQAFFAHVLLEKVETSKGFKLGSPQSSRYIHWPLDKPEGLILRGFVEVKFCSRGISQEAWWLKEWMYDATIIHGAL